MRKPFRMEICKILRDRGPLSQGELLEVLRPDYCREGQLRALDEHLQSLRAVGIVYVASERVEERNGREVLLQSWELSGSGLRRLEKLL